MRGRILLMMMLGLATLVACSRKDSIYLEPGKREGAEPAPPAPKPAPATPAPAAKPAEAPPHEA